MRFLTLLFLFSSSVRAQNYEPPVYHAPITDEAGLISEGLETQLNGYLDKLYKSGGSQISVLTVKSLNGVPIETAAIKTVEKWKLGTEKNDNGVLLMISQQDRSIRIEVGQGLEGTLTDLQSKRIIEDVMVPSFKRGDFDRGVVDGLQRILSQTDPNSKLGKLNDVSSLSDGNRRFNPGGIMGVIWLLMLKFPFLFFLILFLLIMRGPRRRFHRTRGGFGGFGGGFGGGGFGGFSGGGGGGFSGGGASGRW